MSDISSCITVGSAKARPFVKWAGGKRKQAVDICARAPKRFENYYEPFIGGGALFFHLSPKSATLSDINAKLITAYRALQSDPEAVIEQLHTYENTADYYYKIRAKNFDVGSHEERAADFIFCNRVGFNGLYRENASKRFNVPFGNNPKAMICDEVNLRAVALALQGVDLVHDDFATVLGRAKPGDFVYLDPPYAPMSATSSFTAYSSNGFTNADQVRLRDSVRALKASGVHVVISNSATPAIYELYADGFQVEAVQAARSINSKADRRGPVTELIIT